MQTLQVPPLQVLSLQAPPMQVLSLQVLSR
jgi:hypothetical protein